MAEDDFELGRLDLLEALLFAIDRSDDLSPLRYSPLVDVLVRSLENDVGDDDEPLKGQLLSVKVQVLLTLLNVKGKRPISTVTPDSFQAGLRALFCQLELAQSRDMATLRNDIATILLYLVKEQRELRQEFGTFSFKFGTFVFENVLGSDSPLFPLHSRPEDLQCLKIFIYLLTLALKGHCSALYIVERCCLIETAVAICIGPCPLLDPLGGPDDETLHVTSDLLDTLVKICPGRFCQKEGLGAILEYLKVYVRSSQAGCQAKVNTQVLGIFLSVVRSLVVQDSEVLEYLRGENAMEVLLDALGEMSHHDWNPSMDPSMSHILLSIASLACENDQQQRIFMEHNGVKILLRLLNRLIYAPPHKRHTDPTLGLSLGECIWRCLNSNASSLETWLGFEGMFRLLDFLELTKYRGVQLTLFNALLDLCEYPRCMDQVLYWKRRMPFPDHDLSVSSLVDDVGTRRLGQNLSLGSLLCQIWQEEESYLKVERNNGQIQNLEKPLLSDFWQDSKGRIQNPTLDLCCSLRPKIYLLAKKITEATNTEATLFGGLSVKNQVTMELIINFLDLKRAEIWLSMIESLQDVPLVDTDCGALEKLGRIAKNKSMIVKDTQQFLKCRDHEQKLAQERQLHLTLRHSMLQGHLSSIIETEEQARTSSYQLLVDKRLWQKTQLAKARREFSTFQPEARLHLTNNQTLNLTQWDGRTKVVDSEEAGYQEDVISGQVDYGEDGGGEGFFEFEIRTPATVYPPLTTEVTRTADETPDMSPVEGLYEVNPVALAKALSAALQAEKKWSWKSAGDDAWKLRTKWRSTWYH